MKTIARSNVNYFRKKHTFVRGVTELPFVFFRLSPDLRKVRYKKYTNDDV